MREFILEQFRLLGNKIRNHRALEQYVDFCLSNSKEDMNPSQSALHHILPKAKLLPYNEFSNLKQNPWNGTRLSNYYHYYAHYLLVLAVDHISVSHSFCAMHNKDIEVNRISKEDLISEGEYNRIYAERNRQWSERCKEMIEVDGVYMSRATHRNLTRIYTAEHRKNASDLMTGNKNIVNIPGVVDKIRKTKVERNLDKVSAERAAKTMQTEYIDDDGEITTIYRENGIKVSKTLTQEFINDRGEVTTLAKERGKKKQNQMIRDGKWFEIKNVFDEKVSLVLPETMVRQISPALMFKTRDTYLGMAKFGHNHFQKLGKPFLIGLYAERLPGVPREYNLDQDYSPYL